MSFLIIVLPFLQCGGNLVLLMGLEFGGGPFFFFFFLIVNHHPSHLEERSGGKYCHVCFFWSNRSKNAFSFHGIVALCCLSKETPFIFFKFHLSQMSIGAVKCVLIHWILKFSLFYSV